MAVPIVAIVGRPNVGKSSLFNWLVGRRVSIVDPTAGVTRDRISEIIEGEDYSFELTDTGGIGIVDEHKLEADVSKQIQTAIEEATVIILLTDVRDGVMPLDLDVADRLRNISKPVILVVNKCDTPELMLQASDFHRLGYSPLIPVSVLQRKNKDKLLEAITDQLPKDQSEIAETDLKIAIVGKRNVGKSTFVNKMANAERVIVSEIPGTTRDSVDVRFERDGKNFVVIDTAGLRNKSSMANSIEFYSQVRAEESIRRADVVLQFFDCREDLSRIDKQLAGYIYKYQKPAIFVVNKWDLAPEHVSTEEYGEYVEKMFPMLDFVPIAFITAKQGRNVFKVWNLAQNIAKQCKLRIGTGELNRLIEDAWTKNPAPQKGQRMPKIYYATQTAVEPPTIVMMVNNPDLFEETYRRYLLRYLRENSPFQEVPIKMEFRSKKDAQENKRMDRPEGIPLAGSEKKPVPMTDGTKAKKTEATKPPRPLRPKKPKPKKPDLWKL
ncbi:ribosome biogenesis GTPase Der [Telmatocola sphagniphila]|uniref:GTPase Der n=1 Tax=Telmatocola sphagniphila TaxID=1123043 RepID=A0A8E6B1M3_9BACT|nr:ribosome biogenesis GTPase Der [Telmatocola sphagniphila]QVL30178.1 ribosome biogenesis GTPase Der [Telmatocola sphagniphila]